MPQAQRNKRPCPVCGGHGSPLYENVMAPLEGLDMSYTVEACLACESVFANNLATDAEYQEYYSRFSKYDLVPVESDSDTARIHRALATLVTKHVPIDATVLDIGCGNGHLLSCLQAVGFTSLTGIDPAPNAASVAHAHYGLSDIRCGFLGKNDSSITLEKFDIVCLSAVLEHLTDPLAALANALENSAQGAWLALEVPDLDAFDGVTGEPYGELSLEHINYFSERSLRLFLSRLGYALVDFERMKHAGGGSILVLARRANITFSVAKTCDTERMNDYLSGARTAFECKLKDLLPKLSLPTLICGAGSHTARLLPRLQAEGKEKLFVGIIDSNSNLHGACLGSVKIYSHDFLHSCGAQNLLISSFKSERAMKTLFSDSTLSVLGIYL